MRLFFCGKNEAQICDFLVVKKAPSPWKIIFSKKKKKKKSSLFVQRRPTKQFAEVF